MDSGDTAWILASTALVLFMTLPGLALFYAGLVRSKSVLSVVMQCFSVAALASVLWMILGYSMSFGESAGGVVGSLEGAFLWGIGTDAVRGPIPEIAFAMFQMTFAVITPALIVGAYVERIKFKAVLIFSGAWLLVVYAPICHWVWGGGWLGDRGVMDFAGGLVVHTSAGVSALVVAALLGKRQGFPGRLSPPHNPGMTAAGAAMLWVGWFGFNGGSQLAADGTAGMAITATHLAAAAAALVWMGIEWVRSRKPTLVGTVTGVIAGLATVTPASGFVGPVGGIILGTAGGSVCFFAVEFVKERFRIDDSLDVFAVHGVGGLLGTLLVTFVATETVGGAGLSVDGGIGEQLGIQALGAVVTIAWAGGFSYLLAKGTAALTGGLRVGEEAELEGLDLADHGEGGYDL